MRSFIILAISFTVAAVNIVLSDKPDHTTRYYRKAQVFSSFSQNKFLSLPEKPVSVFQGFHPIHVHAPLYIDTYAWDLSGFYQAQVTGKHYFSIDRTKIAYIQIGRKKLKPQTFHDEKIDEYEDLLEPRTVFSDSAVTLTLIEDNYYHVKIFYIAGAERVPIYVTEPTGFQIDLATRVEEAVFDPMVRSWNEESKPSKGYLVPSFYQRVGFFSIVYQLPREFTDYKNAQCDLSTLQKVHQGYFVSRDEEIKLPSVTAPVIREINGHFRPLDDGKFRIHMAGKHIACLQIGPKRRVQNPYYVIDDDWKLLDTRGNTSADVHLELSYFYPFRVVLLGNEEEFSLDVTVHDPDSKNVDLFGLWKNLAPSSSFSSSSHSPSASLSAISIPTLTSSSLVETMCPVFKKTVTSPLILSTSSAEAVFLSEQEPSFIAVSERLDELLESTTTQSSLPASSPFISHGFFNETVTQSSEILSTSSD